VAVPRLRGSCVINSFTHFGSNSVPTAAESYSSAIMSFPSSGGGAGGSANAKSTGPKPPGVLQRARELFNE
jgi:hypothetical protein